MKRGAKTKELWKDPESKLRRSKRQRTFTARVCVRCKAVYMPSAWGQKYCGKPKDHGSCSWKRQQELQKTYIPDPVKSRVYQKRYQDKLEADPERYAAWLAKSREKKVRRQGMTQAQYDSMRSAQRGVCAICGAPQGRSLMGRSKDLAIDHDHSTGKIRGLLCDDCNIGLGLFRDDPGRLIRAGLYILKSHGILIPGIDL